MPKIDAATRYGAACNELCTRLSIRNNTLLHFTAFSSGVIAFAIKGGSSVSIIGVTIPYLALFVVLISSYHERAIYKLAEYQAKLIALDEEDSIPNWYSEEYYAGLRSTRIMRDWAQLYIIVPISVGSLLLIYSRWEDYPTEYRDSYLVAAILAAVCLVAAVFILLSNMRAKKGRFHFSQKAETKSDVNIKP